MLNIALLIDHTLKASFENGLIISIHENTFHFIHSTQIAFSKMGFHPKNEKIIRQENPALPPSDISISCSELSAQL